MSVMQSSFGREKVFTVASDVFARKEDGVARFSRAVGLVAMNGIDGIDGGHGERLLVKAEIRRFDGEEGRVGFHVTTTINQVGCHMR